MNLFEPRVKLIKKVRVDSRFERVCSLPQTPLDRLPDYHPPPGPPIPPAVETVIALRACLDPFALARRAEAQWQRIYALREGQAGVAALPARFDERRGQNTGSCR